MKAIVRSVLLASALLVPGFTAALAQDVAPRPISLDEAVRLARRNSPQAIAARNTVRGNAAAVRTSYSEFLPSLSLSTSARRSGGNATNPDGTIRPFVNRWSYSRGLSTQLQLFNGGQRYFNLRAAQANVDAAEASEVAASFNVALSVKQQYYAVLAARESESAARKQLEQSEQQLRAAVARVAAGAATRSDSLRSSITVGNARLAILTAQNNLSNANAALSTLVGSEAIVTALDSDTSETGTITVGEEDLFAMAEGGPDVRQALAQVAAAKQQSRASKGTYLPSLSASFNSSGSAASETFEFTGQNFRPSRSTSLSLSFPIFNGLQREESVVRARIGEENAAATLRDARLAARQQMVQQLGAFRTAEARVAIQVASVAAGEEDLRVQQERYNLGASTLLDLLTSQTTLDQARQALIQARLDARTAKAQIEALIGRDLQ